MRADRGVISALALAGVALVACSYGLGRFAYGLFVPEFAAEFDLTAALSGVIGAGSYVGYCIAIVGSTLATARWGARPVAVAAGVLATAGIAAVAVAPNAFVLAGGILVAGLSTGVASPPLAAAVARGVREGARDTAQTIVNAGTGFGVVVSGSVASVLLDSWRLAWVAFAVLTAIVTVWVWRVIPPVAADAARTNPTTRPAAAAPRRALAWLVMAAFVMGTGSIAVWTFGREIVVQAGVADWVAPAVWIAIGAAGILGALAGTVVRRWGLRASWAVGMIAQAAGGAGLAFGASIPVLAIASGALFGAAYIALSGVLLLWGTRLQPAAPATGVGIAFLALAVGQAIGAPLAGAAGDAVPLLWIFAGCAAITILGAALGPGRRSLSQGSIS